MESFISLLKFGAILIASATLGNWFFTEVKKSKQKGAPWYAPYISIPGIIVIGLVILLPILAWIIKG